ncbi:MAG: ribosome small subunit-dependent GTPase A [Vicinamibacterales bacterium]
MSSLIELGWSDHFAAQCGADDGHVRARVVEELRGTLRVAGEYSGLADVAGRVRRDAQSSADLPTVGDWVLISPPAGDGRGSIRRLLTRSTALMRRASGTVTTAQVVAANIDTVFIVEALSEDVNANRIERYLTMVWESGASAVVVLNKADVCASPESSIDELHARMPGVDIVAVSAFGELTALDPHLSPGRTVAFVGPSGVGKSSLINALLGESVQRTGAVRAADGKGRHTTTTRQLRVLDRGAIVIDTPGTRELQPWVDTAALERTFDDIAALASRCRFTDCAHQHEPGCAVRAAIASGELSEARLEHHDRLARELAYESRKRDVHASLEEKRRWKNIHRAQKARRRFEEG